MAEWLTQKLQEAPGWELCAPVPMSTVCFRHRPPGLDTEAELEGHNRDLMARVNGSGRVFISHAVLRGRFVLRATIGGLRTEPEDVAELWGVLEQAATGG
jgi:aromatic-L-amino-acid decarboxylase